jgi:hypothetical protein
MQTSLIGMEACSGAHFLGKALSGQGHDVRLISVQFVKPFVKSNKSDFIDAEAIAEAVQRMICDLCRSRPMTNSICKRSIAFEIAWSLGTPRSSTRYELPAGARHGVRIEASQAEGRDGRRVAKYQFQCISQNLEKSRADLDQIGHSQYLANFTAGRFGRQSVIVAHRSTTSTGRLSFV